MEEGNLYQERAEKLDKEEVQKWMTLSDNNVKIVERLLNNSTKLLIGPRGSGKSMFMRWAYYKALDSKEVLPIYVNYEKYLYAEPLLHKVSNGREIFSNWVLAKIIIETSQTLRDCELYDEDELRECVSKYFSTEYSDILNLVYKLEGGTLFNNDVELNIINLSVGSIIDFIDFLLEKTGRRRAVLLLDDAAHAFSSELQRDFFEIFRILKSNRTSAKASVYPGITSYSPYFNVGHDALFLNVEYPPEDTGYIEFCDQILMKRLGEAKYSILNNKQDGLKSLYYAANGIPRGIIVMAEYILEETPSEELIKDAYYYDAIEMWVENVEKFYNSLQERLPRYINFIEVGFGLYRNFAEEIKEFNKNKDESQKAVYVGISKPIDNGLQKVLDLLEYSGLITERRDISKGVKGTFKRYKLHLGTIIQYNSLAQGKGKTLSYISESLEQVKVRQFKRLTTKNLFTQEIKDKCIFNLPPCNNCGEKRISENAKFCSYCGSELKSASLFFEILQQDISILPLTEKRIKDIKDGSKIRTIQDILMDENGLELKKVRYIKGHWAQKIRAYAEEFIGG
ncbi:zinc ribbon domain-containing protein [Lysinibacillus fusiformis]|uniref:zinc ribbon domain-containing protein n=1 Tax=Lysinibacillus fusiformis TaxID=28031 RepID=UPI00046A03B2|nr:zinc ribbon domain-containing protein [Lysinibacillus fusiformis]